MVLGCFRSGGSGLRLSWCLNIPRDGKPTNLLGNLFQWLITFAAEILLPLFKWKVGNQMCASCLLLPSRRFCIHLFTPLLPLSIYIICMDKRTLNLLFPHLNITRSVSLYSDVITLQMSVHFLAMNLPGCFTCVLSSTQWGYLTQL